MCMKSFHLQNDLKEIQICSMPWFLTFVELMKTGIFNFNFFQIIL